MMNLPGCVIPKWLSIFVTITMLIHSHHQARPPKDIEMQEIMVPGATPSNEYSKTKAEYQAESPDEKALVEAARDLGYTLQGRTTTAISLMVGGVELTYMPLAVNKFDSDRKRMSIVLREPSGNIKLLVKGADTSMLSRGLFEPGQTTKEVSKRGRIRETYIYNNCHPSILILYMFTMCGQGLVDHLKLFSEEGLRTLVLG